MSNDLPHLTLEVALSPHGRYHLGGQTLTLPWGMWVLFFPRSDHNTANQSSALYQYAFIFYLFVLRHIYKGWFVCITNCQAFTATPHALPRCFNGALWVGSNTALFFGLHPIILKNGPMSDWPNGKRVLLFPVVSTFVPREYRFRFPPLCVNYPSLYPSVAARILWFSSARGAFKCALLPNVTLVWSRCIFNGKQVVWPVGPYL